MKIKTVKEMRLDELLKYVWDNGITDVICYDQNGNDLYIDKDGLIVGSDYSSKDDRYKVEVEEEITEESSIDMLVIDEYKVAYSRLSTSIKAAITIYGPIKFIYLQNSDGSIGELIWKDEKMVGGSEG